MTPALPKMQVQRLCLISMQASAIFVQAPPLKCKCNYYVLSACKLSLLCTSRYRSSATRCCSSGLCSSVVHVDSSLGRDRSVLLVIVEIVVLAQGLFKLGSGIQRGGFGMAFLCVADEDLPVIDGDKLLITDDPGTEVLPDAVEASTALQTSCSHIIDDEALLPEVLDGIALPPCSLPTVAIADTAQLGFNHQPLAVDADGLPYALPAMPYEDDNHSQCVLPSIDPPTPPSAPRRKRARRRYELGHGETIWDRPHLRTNTLADIPEISAKYGSDLLHEDPPPEWVDRAKCKALLNSLSIAFATLPWFLLEIFAGCARLTEVAKSLGLAVGPPVDIDPAIGGGMSYNLLSRECRKVVWALIVIGVPAWVHVGFPCTFWSQMAHFTRRDCPEVDENTRLENLVFIMFARQVGWWQHRHGKHFSFENPPRCRSWCFDVVGDMINMFSMDTVDFHCCMYGAVDPGNGLPYKKAMRIAMTLPLHELSVCCDKSHAHQTVEGVVGSGSRKGTARSKVSGEYTTMLCKRWVAIVQADIVARL